MTDANSESNYTPYTLLTILVVTALIGFYAYSIDLVSHLDDSATSFQSSSSFVLLWRISCLFVGVCAIVYMLKCGPGNMRVMSMRDSEELILYPDGLSKFVTFSSWTLLSNVAYFLISIIYHVLEKYEFSTPNLLLQLQIITFCTGIAMAFMTATIVRHIILPDEVRIGRNHDHMFLFHEQIMHNFAAIFLAVELILLQPELKPEFAIIGLFIGILYVAFSYLFAYFGSGYIVYSFLHPKPKIAPILVFVLAGMISLFYTGLWFVSTLENLFAIPILIIWISVIVQFRATHNELANETTAS